MELKLVAVVEFRKVLFDVMLRQNYLLRVTIHSYLGVGEGIALERE